MKNDLAENPIFIRFLEILPGAAAWTTLLMPIIMAPFLPIFVASFILVFNLYWFFKAINLSRYLLNGFFGLKRNMSINWLERCKKTDDLDNFARWLETKGETNEDKHDLLELKEIQKGGGALGNWREIYNLAVIAISSESLDILKPSIEAIKNSNFPNENIMIVLACEERYPSAVKIAKIIKKKYGSDFKYLDYFVHPKDLPNEVRGKGPNISFAAKKFKEYFDKQKSITYGDVLVTTLDADHIAHKEYFGRVTYCYLLDGKNKHKTYQPVPLLFNNIWDTPAPNRIAAVGSSFWQIVEAMRPYRLRTFAAHTQSLETLVDTDFWALHSIVEDGHQFWRTYFRYGGDHEMVPLTIPVYQDAVLAETYWKTFKNQYLQRRRWAWGASDFPFIVTHFMKEKKISFFEKIVQTFRHFSGGYSWATASFLIAGAWVPLIFNNSFQDTVLAHNVTVYSSFVLRLAWAGIFLNVWIYLKLLPPRPKKYGLWRHFGMVWQWLLSPVVAIVLSSLPCLDSQTRLMLGKRLEFWITPKVRKA
ncbi:hypothetical protein COY62_03015 [bacterium (Candidatus Howlettbacteria) CG_4_10_14_0_8_um_filter_40_9]|nr:MAG: hypothetical protein COY62_03015 [bacterium (Candidatus Howlettbacteria) CG_4_10_14_0_8_um_filter_40_9]